MTDFEDALDFRGHLLGVVEIRLLPRERMAGGRFQAAFSHGHAFTERKKKRRKAGEPSACVLLFGI